MTTLADVRAACRLTIASTAIVDDYAGRLDRRRAAFPLRAVSAAGTRGSGLHGRHARIRSARGHVVRSSIVCWR